ncbi:hypothetical protein Q5692_40280, partial [Microcoleus sp. C2C3]|uniref:hypothetical protein n=1 Tax=Microcoleus sp. C2C3 TaxID=3055324 RepID=UPI002FD41F1F
MRLLVSLFVAVSLLISTPANAGIIDTGAKAYAAYRLVKIGTLLVRYGKQIQNISKVTINSRQFALLKQCFQTRNCASYKANPKEWGSTIKNKLIKEWEFETGQT